MKGKKSEFKNSAHNLSRHLAISFLILYFSPFTGIAQTNRTNISFIFNLKTGAKTSAAVFKKNGRLVKTLWSGVHYDAGKHVASWDETDDYDQPVVRDNYLIKVLSNNVSYKWEGVIGNTSDSSSGPTVLHSLQRIHSVAISGNTAYYTTNYNEQGSGTFKFLLNNPYKKTTILNKGMAATFVATDGKIVYWGGNDANNGNNCFVYGTNCIDDSETTFEKGTIVKTIYARTYKSAIDVFNGPNTSVSGLAVQNKGRYLFITHQKLNSINVFDKVSGDLIRKIAIDLPGIIAIDKDDNLWVNYKINDKFIIRKFKVNNDGALLPTEIAASDLENPVALSISPDNKILLVADANQSQQLRAYSTVTGALQWQFGEKNGYLNSPLARNDKFFFGDIKGTLGSTIAFEDNGSFWVEDSGNCRLQHFSADLEFINRIMFLNASYSLTVDSNNPERLFSDYLEFKIDYSKSLKPHNGSWILVKNWGYNISNDLQDKYNALKSVTSFSNGHTFALIFSKPTRKWLLVELPRTGPLRITNIEFSNDNFELYKDGSLRIVRDLVVGKTAKWLKRPLIKFNKLGEPVWGNEELLASLDIVKSDPIPRLAANMLHPASVTASNVIIVFGNTISNFNTANWHLGGIRLNDHKWLWQTAKGTTVAYKGPYPTDGAYDNGNSVKYAGSTSLIIDRNIFWGYFGEFWKNSQLNKWNQFYDDGLFIGQFGTTGPETMLTDAPPMMAGNAFAAVVVKTKTGQIYLYHNDESYHSGVHRWMINNLSSIHEQLIPIRFK